MEHDVWGFLNELVILLAGALLLGAVMERLRQSAIVGYLLAGTLLGPNVLHAIGEADAMETIAELGVSLLLFAIGLEFSVRRLLAIGPIGLLGGSVQVLVTMAVAAGITAPFLGFSFRPAIAVGAMVALSSTACVLRVLRDRTEIDSVHGRNALGILLLQDVAVVPLVLLVTMLAGAGSIADMAVGMATAIGLIAALVVTFFLLSYLVLNRAMGTETLVRSRELSLLVAVVLAFGSALAAHELGLSPALGAFLAGIMLAESPFAVKVRADVGALRTLFITLFFASVGMLGDPRWIVENAATVGLVVVALIVGKAVIVAAVAMLFGYGTKQAVATGVCLAQVGEFSFVLAGVARGDADGEALVDNQTFRLIVSATLVTLVITPYLVAGAPLAGSWAARLVGSKRTGAPGPGAKSPDEPSPDADQRRIVLVGFGPAGQRVASRARRMGLFVTVLDLHPRNIQLAREAGYEAHLGDATHGEVLEHAHIANAHAVVIALPDHQAAMSIAQQVRTLVPHMPVVARSRFSRFVHQITRSGADVVVDEEVETGRRLAMELTRALGRAEA